MSRGVAPGLPVGCTACAGSECPPDIVCAHCRVGVGTDAHTRQAHNVPIVYTCFTSRLPAADIMHAVMQTTHHHSPHAAPALLQLNAAAGRLQITVEGVQCVVQLFAEGPTPSVESSVAASGSRRTTGTARTTAIAAAVAAVAAVAEDAPSRTIVQVRRISGDPLIFRKYYAWIYDTFFASTPPSDSPSAAASTTTAASELHMFVCPSPPQLPLTFAEEDTDVQAPAVAATAGVSISVSARVSGCEDEVEHDDRLSKIPRLLPPE
jgi:hypothetical protein